MLTEETITLMDGVDEKGNIRVKRVTRILKDGEPYGSEQYHRHVLSPGDDLTDEDPEVSIAATALWTPGKVKAHTTEAIAEIEEEKLKLKQANDDLQKEIDEETIKKAELLTLRNDNAALEAEIKAAQIK